MSEDSSDLSEPSQPSEPTESSEPKNADSEDEWMPDAEADSGELRIPQEEQEDDANDYESQEEEEDEEDAEELEDAFYENQLDPISLLENMGKHATGSREEDEVQPYQVLNNTARQARAMHILPSGRSKKQQEGSSEEEANAKLKTRKRGRRSRGQFGADVDDIWDEGSKQDDEHEHQQGFDVAQKRMKARVKRRGKRAGKKTRELPEEVSKAQGEANMLFAKGRYEQAIPLLEEVIKAVPGLSDPYKTMGNCYEQTGNRRKALDFYMITAHMTPKDIQLWKRLAALSTEMGFSRQAIYCLTKVLVRDKNNADICFDRAMQYIDVGEIRRAITGLERVLTIRPQDAEAPMILARIHHQMENPEKAIQVLEAFIRAHPLETDPTHVNILAELYMDGKHYRKAEQLISRVADQICKEGLPIDLQTKLGLCYVHLDQLQQAVEQLQILFRDPLEQDLCLDAADVLRQCGHPAEAVELYKRVGIETLQANGQWIKMADCFLKQDDLPAAVNLYVELANGVHLPIESRREAAISLAELLSGKKLKQQTISALKHLDKLGIDDMDLLTRKAQVLLDIGDQEGYLNLILPIIKDTLRAATIRKPKSQKSTLDKQAEQRKRILERMKKIEEPGVIFKGYVAKDRRAPHRREADEELAQMLEEQDINAEEPIKEPELPKEQKASLLMEEILKNDRDFQTVVKASKVLIDINEPLQASEMLADCITFLARRWKDRECKEKRDILRWRAAEAAVAAGEPALAMHHVRQVCATWPGSAAVWNVLCQATITVPSMLRQAHRTVAVQALEAEESLAMRLINGHCQAIDGAHGSALKEYMAAYHSDPEEPLSLLCVAMAHLNQAVSRRAPDRDAAVLAAFAFLQAYCKRRKNSQEAYYNMGRAAHHVGLLHLAVPWYYRALEADVPLPWRPKDDSRQAPVNVDLRPEIAYNLAILLRSSGADELAKEVMVKHLTI